MKKILKALVFVIMITLISSCSIGTSSIIRNYTNFPITIKASLNFKNERVTKILEVYLSEKIIENEDLKNKNFIENEFNIVEKYDDSTNEMSIIIPPKSTVFLNSYRIIELIEFVDNNGESVKKDKSGNFFRIGSKTYYYNLK